MTTRGMGARLESSTADWGCDAGAAVHGRIWCGATVDHEDLEALMPWLSWAYHEVSKAK
jgi:phosphoserine aminotransferase